MKQFVAQHQNKNVEFFVTPLSQNRFKVVFQNKEFVLNAIAVEPHHYSILCGEQSYDISLMRQKAIYQAFVGGAELSFVLKDEKTLRRESFGAASVAGAGEVVSPMPGKVIEVKVSVDQEVRAGEGLVVVEAMKMQNELKSIRDGVVKEVFVKPGQSVEQGAVLIVVA